jgi:hypothetical protein
MQFTYSNSNNYLAGAKEVNDISTNIFNTSRQTGVDVNNLIQTERKARASKADAKNAAEGTIGQKAVNTNAIMKVNQIDAKSKKDVEKIMKPAKMAGALAATVNVGNMGLMMHQDMKLAQKEKAEERRFRNEEYKKQDERDEARTKMYKEYLESMKPGNKLPVPPSQTTKTSPLSTPVSAAPAAGPNQLPKSEIRQLAINSGFTPEQAGVVVGIAGGESGFDPTNSTRRSGLFKKDGEDSVGLMQINWGYHKDKGWLDKVGVTKREDLFDPVKNMAAAKYLHQNSGSFSDWTVYNEGLYQQHM